jgi:hypothetical protein
MKEIKAVVQLERQITVPSVGIQGLGATTVNLEDLKNIDASNLTNGSVLVYNSSTRKWVASTILELQVIDGGTY